MGAPPESQSAPVSPYPLPGEQSRTKPSGLVAWLHSAWDFLVNLLGGGTQTAQAAGLQQAYPPPGDPTPTPPSTSTPVPTPTSTPVPTATPVPLEEILYTYDIENRLVSVSSGEVQASFVYDGDGQRVASFINGSVTVYIGEVFEWEVTAGSMRRYYYAGTQRVAVRTGSAAPVWLLGDHLGSTSVAANPDGSLLSRQGYLPWGELRFADGSLPGRYQFTGQASYEAEFGLYYYKARWYDPHLGRFFQPDSMVPDPGNPLDWDRYQYARANPLKYTDPTGHFPWLLIPILVFIATIPGDTGLYEVDPVTSAVGDAALRFVDPIDAVFTGVECLQGQCTGEDILFAILPVVNGGLDDAADAARAVRSSQIVGKWIRRTEHMSDSARAYQRFISGRSDDLVYEIGGYSFDGFNASSNTLLEAKDIPLNFVDKSTGDFKPWVSGTSDWLTQAQNQVNASGGLQIQWFFSSLAAREAMYNLFLKENPDLLKSIELIYKPIE